MSNLKLVLNNSGTKVVSSRKISKSKICELLKQMMLTFSKTTRPLGVVKPGSIKVLLNLSFQFLLRKYYRGFNHCFCFLLGLLNKEKMKAPIPFVILLHTVVVHCQKVVSKRGSGKSCHFIDRKQSRYFIKQFVVEDKMCFCLCSKISCWKKFNSLQTGTW